MRNLSAFISSAFQTPSCLLDSSDKTQWPFLQIRDTGCVGGSASTSLWSEAVMVHFPRWNDQNEICKEKRYWNGKSWATSAACTSTKVVPMHTIQSKVENVNQCWKSIWRTAKLEIFQKVWGIHQNVWLKCRLVNQCLAISKHFLCKDLGTVIQLIANPFIFVASSRVNSIPPVLLPFDLICFLSGWKFTQADASSWSGEYVCLLWWRSFQFFGGAKAKQFFSRQDVSQNVGQIWSGSKSPLGPQRLYPVRQLMRWAHHLGDRRDMYVGRLKLQVLSGKWIAVHLVQVRQKLRFSVTYTGKNYIQTNMII